MSLMERPTTLQTLTSVVKVPVTSGHMAQEDHHLTIKIPSSVLKLIPLFLVLRQTEVELLVTSVTNKCSPTSQWSTRFVIILKIFRNTEKLKGSIDSQAPKRFRSSRARCARSGKNGDGQITLKT